MFFIFFFFKFSIGLIDDNRSFFLFIVHNGNMLIESYFQWLSFDIKLASSLLDLDKLSSLY